MTEKTHYPDYDLLSQKEEWDAHTREIVLKRLGPFPRLKYLDDYEEAMIRAISQHLVYDDREEIIGWLVYHLDQQLRNEYGESQRKPETPPMPILIRQGLKAIDQVAQSLYSQEFLSIGVKEQFEILASIQLAKAYPIPEWSTVPQKDLFNKLLDIIISGYYSHPIIWQEIGHGGPAYPRGYYRIEMAFLDPWEPKRARSGEGKKDGEP